MGIGFVLYGLGLVVASVTKTTVLFYLNPVWATFFAYILLSERSGFGRWLAIIGGTAGCLLVMRVNPFAFGYDNADLLGLMSGMAWAAGSVVTRRYPKASFLHITFMQYLVGGLSQPCLWAMLFPHSIMWWRSCWLRFGHRRWCFCPLYC